MIHLDTHVAAWLFAGDLTRFPGKVLERLEEEDLEISPMVVLELQYLYEIGRASTTGEEVARELEHGVGLKVCPRPLPAVIAAALRKSWTRDPFDRIIASQAEVAGVGLLTKDRALLENEAHARWS